MSLHPMVRMHIRKWYEKKMDQLHLLPIEEIRAQFNPITTKF